jgi:hypothetical protein
MGIKQLNPGSRRDEYGEILGICFEQSAKARAKVAERYNLGRKQAAFCVGDLVMVRVHPLSSRSQRRSAKLDLNWSTPFTIARFVSPVTVLLANPATGVIIRKAHVSQLKTHFSS